MARDISDVTLIENRDALIHVLSDGCKPQSAWRIGTEHEKFGFNLKDRTPVPYEGPRGIEKLLRSMEQLLGWEPILDHDKIIGLVEPKGGGAISLEPGGQFELSGAPLETIHQTCREVHTHLAQVQQVAGPMQIGFLGLGMNPKWGCEETPIMPKSRYKIMANYMPKVGTHGLDMMFRTATIQVNLDFSSEADMVKKLRVGLALQPIATAIFANSPFSDGKPNGFLSYRAEIWKYTDANRTGMLPFAFDEGFGFEQYVDWALDVPMYFLKRGDSYHDCTDTTFRQFMNGALRERFTDGMPTIGDWNNHLSTLFPDVRLKSFLEMRGADGGPWREICALPALWVGLLYDGSALEAAFDLIQDWTLSEREALRNNVPKLGFKTPFRHMNVLDIAREVYAISQSGLQSRALLNPLGDDERHYLSPIEEILVKAQSPAERMLEQYYGEWGGNIDHIFNDYAY